MDGLHRGGWRRVASRSLIYVLTFLLAFGGTPAQLWAEGAEGIDEAVLEPASALVAEWQGDTEAGREPDRAPSPVVSPAAPVAPSTVAASPAAARATAAAALDSDWYVVIQSSGADEDSNDYVKGDLASGMTLWANVYDYDDWRIDADPAWSYQWMSAETKSGEPGDYEPIEGQVSQSLKIDDALAGELAGRYVAVRVSQGSTALWGPALWGGGGLYGDNVPGPVTAPGSHALSRVEMLRGGERVDGDVDAILAPGDELAARAFTGGGIGGGGTEVDPADVSFTWTLLESESDSSGQAIGGSPAAEIPTGESAIGKYVRLEARAGANAVSCVKGPIAKKGALRIAGVTISVPGGKGAPATGDELVALPVLMGGKPAPADSVSFRWSIKRPGGAYEELAGETGPGIAVDASWAGCRLKVSVMAGGFNVVAAETAPVIDAVSADVAVAALDGADFMPVPAYGSASNVAKIVDAKLAELGYADATVRVASATTGAGGATVSAADDATNGDVTFYYEDPELTARPAGKGESRVAFDITLGGATATWTRYITIRWDMGHVQERLEQLLATELSASSLVPTEGGEADDATGAIAARKDLKLPRALGDWAILEWSSSNPDVVSPAGAVARLQDRDSDPVDLTATATFGLADRAEDPATATRGFTVVAKAIASDTTDAERIDAALDGFSAIQYDTEQCADLSAITGDLRLPSFRSLGLKGSGKASYALEGADGDAFKLTGYRLNVTRPAPGMPDAKGTLAVTVTKGEATRTRRFDLVVKALGTAEIDAELALMERAKAGYAEALLNGNASAGAVLSSLKGFQQARLDESGELVWARDRSQVSGQGIAPVSIDLSHPSEQWDRFKSSAPSIIESETLRLLRTPEYNTRVTVTSCLSSEKYEGYYERYRDDESIDPAVLAKYKALSRQEVSATFTVVGTTGRPDPEAQERVTVSARVVGVSEPGSDGSVREESWIPLTEFSFEKGDGKTAWDVFAFALDEAGYTYSRKGGDPYSITTPDGSRTLAMSDAAPWRYWSFYIDGGFAQTAPSSTVLEDGDVIELRYAIDGASILPENDIVIDPSAPRPDWGSDWPGFTAASKPTSALTPVEAVEEKWVLPLGGGQTDVVSEPIIAGGFVYVAAADSLHKIDAATGADVAQAKLATRIDSTSRMVYHEGIIVVPLAGGRLQALTADALTTVWLTDALPDLGGAAIQSLGTLVVRDGYVYAGTTNGNNGGPGYMTCVNLQTGAVRWTREAESGFYWAGSVSVGSHLVVGDDAGNVYSYDPATGEVRGTPCKLPARVRTTLVADGGHVYAVSYDGVLHKLVVAEDGSVTEVASVSFGRVNTTSTPTIVDGKAVVCGQSQTEGNGPYMKRAAIFLIDLESMTVEREVTKTGSGEPLPTAPAQATPLVSVQPDGAYAYFTVNSLPGGVYRYKLGDDTVDMVYTPTAENQQYCMNSVIAGADGSLYYVNSSGTLIAVSGAPSHTVSFDLQDGEPAGRVFVRHGLPVSEPEPPTRDGYAFRGWFVDAPCTEAWDFSQAVPGDMTLYAKWERLGEPGLPGGAGGDVADQQPGGPSSQGHGAADADASRAVGVVAPSKKPVDAAKKADGASSVPVADDAESSSASASVLDVGADGAAPSPARPLASVAIAAGAVGIAGVIAAGLWLLATRRRPTN